MSKHSLPSGDVAKLLQRFSLLKQKARTRTGAISRLLSSRKLGWMVSGSTVYWRARASKAMWSILRRS